MELIILLVVAGVVGFFIGKSRHPKSSPSASQQIIDAQAKEPQDVEKPPV